MYKETWLIFISFAGAEKSIAGHMTSTQHLFYQKMCVFENHQHIICMYKCKKCNAYICNIYMWYITFITICAIVNIHMAKYKTVGASVALSAQPNGPRFFQRATFGSPWVPDRILQELRGAGSAFWLSGQHRQHRYMTSWWWFFFKGWMVKHVKRISWICCQYWLVVYPSLWKILVAMIIPNIWEKNVPNHQPVIELSPKGLVLLKALRECLRDSLRAAYAPAVLAYAQVE